MAKDQLVVVLKNAGEVVDCNQLGNDFLLSSPRGAYTAARTVNGNRVFDYDFHVKRLSQSVDLMLRDNAPTESFPSPLPLKIAGADFSDISLVRSPTSLHSLLTPLLRMSISRFHRLNMKGFTNGVTNGATKALIGDVLRTYMGECKITILIAWGNNSHALGGPFDIFVHIQAMSAIANWPVKVQVYGSPRTNPNAKDSQWVRDRQALENLKPADVNEILLVDANGGITEGMSSNFFVIMGGYVITPDEGILKGTVRDVTLLVCAELGIPVKLQNPLLAEIDQWDGAFITSTSRLVLPIGELNMHSTDIYQSPNQDAVRRVMFTDMSLVDKIRKALLAKIEEVGTRIF